MNISLPTSIQWKKIRTALVFAFISGFLATFIAQGGIQVGLGWEGTISLLGGAFVAGINGTAYTLWITFFRKPE